MATPQPTAINRRNNETKSHNHYFDQPAFKSPIVASCLKPAVIRLITNDLIKDRLQYPKSKKNLSENRERFLSSIKTTA